MWLTAFPPPPHPARIVAIAQKLKNLFINIENPVRILYHFTIKGLRMQSGLYIVGTPIGNLSDMSPRAIETLKNADLIAAEDTRVFAKLASHFDIKTPRVACHDHNERDVVPELVEKLQNGMTIAAVSDAGMPAVSDPGFRIRLSLLREFLLFRAQWQFGGPALPAPARQSSP